MFPLKTRQITGYKFLDQTFYGTKHLGTDYGMENLTLYAPFDGTIVSAVFGPEGGNTLSFKPDNQNVVIRFLHLSKFYLKSGHVKMGTPLAVTGNTGSETKAGHLHIDISKNAVNIYNIKNFIDPEKFDWIPFPIVLNVSLIMNTPHWKSLNDHLVNAKQWFQQASGGKINLDIVPVYGNISGWDLEANPVTHISERWFNEFILPLRFPNSHIVIINTGKFPNSVFGDPTATELGFAYKYNTDLPLKIQLTVDELDDYPPYYPAPLSAFAKYICHEICHLLYSICGNVIPGGDYTHNHFYGENGYEIKPEQCFNDFDYETLAKKIGPNI